MRAPEREFIDTPQQLAPDHDGPVLDERAALKQLEGTPADELPVVGAAEERIPPVLDPAVGVFRSAFFGLLFWGVAILVAALFLKVL
jgi:hypothetical protein